MKTYSIGYKEGIEVADEIAVKVSIHIPLCYQIEIFEGLFEKWQLIVGNDNISNVVNTMEYKSDGLFEYEELKVRKSMQIYFIHCYKIQEKMREIIENKFEGLSKYLLKDCE